jgi:hypothetical protein
VLQTIVVKFMTTVDGARFRIGAKTEQEQIAYYTAKQRPLPDWIIGYSEEVTPPQGKEEKKQKIRFGEQYFDFVKKYRTF